MPAHSAAAASAAAPSRPPRRRAPRASERRRAARRPRRRATSAVVAARGHGEHARLGAEERSPPRRRRARRRATPSAPAPTHARSALRRPRAPLGRARPASAGRSPRAAPPPAVGAPRPPRRACAQHAVEQRREAQLAERAQRPRRGVQLPQRTAARSMSTGTSRRIVATVRLARASSACSRRFSPSLPLISPACSSTASSVPYSAISFAAVFSPTPGHAGDVVRGVALQAEVVGDLRRRHAESSRRRPPRRRRRCR